MNQTDFSERLTNVGEAFGKKLADKQIAQYYEHFQTLNDYQWRKLCDWAVESCDRFPTVSAMKQAARELHFYERSARDEPTAGLTVVCSCGASFFAYDGELKPGMMFQCVGGMGEPCNRKFQTEWLRKEAHDRVVWVR